VEITKTIQDYAGETIYFTQNAAAEQEITRNLGYFIERMQLACYEGQENCAEDLPIKNCSYNLISIKQGDFVNVTEEDNCIFIISNNTIREADAFLYKVLGIKQ